MLGIIVALKQELDNLKDRIDIIEDKTVCGKRFLFAKICGKEVIVAISNAGKVAAGQTAQILIDKFDVDSILNFGSCGGMDSSVSATDVCAVEKCCQYDFDLSELDKCPVAYNQNYDSIFIDANTDNLDFLKKASLATSDRFTYKKEDVDFVRELKCNICDMEGAGIAQVCVANGVPFYAIKGVTDVYGSGTQSEQFVINMITVKEKLANAVIEFVNKKC